MFTVAICFNDNPLYSDNQNFLIMISDCIEYAKYGTIQNT